MADFLGLYNLFTRKQRADRSQPARVQPVSNPFADDPFRRGRRDTLLEEGYAYIASSPLEERFERERRQQALSPLERDFEERQRQRQQEEDDDDDLSPLERDFEERRRQRQREEDDLSPLERDFEERQRQREEEEDDDEALSPLEREFEERRRQRQQEEDEDDDLSPLERDFEERRRQRQLERGRQRRQEVIDRVYEDYIRRQEESRSPLERDFDERQRQLEREEREEEERERRDEEEYERQRLLEEERERREEEEYYRQEEERQRQEAQRQRLIEADQRLAFDERQRQRLEEEDRLEEERQRQQEEQERQRQQEEQERLEEERQRQQEEQERLEEERQRQQEEQERLEEEESLSPLERDFEERQLQRDQVALPEDVDETRDDATWSPWGAAKPVAEEIPEEDQQRQQELDRIRYDQVARNAGDMADSLYNWFTNLVSTFATDEFAATIEVLSERVSLPFYDGQEGPVAYFIGTRSPGDFTDNGQAYRALLREAEQQALSYLVPSLENFIQIGQVLRNDSTLPWVEIRFSSILPFAPEETDEIEDREEEAPTALPHDANETRDDATWDPFGSGRAKVVFDDPLDEQELQEQDEEFYEQYAAGKVAVDDEDEDETDVIAGASELTPEIIEDLYYAKIDADPLSLTYLEYQVVYGSLRPDFAGGPRVGGGGEGGPGGRFGQEQLVGGDEGEPEARVLEPTEPTQDEQAEEDLEEGDVDVSDLDHAYYYWDETLGLVRVVDGLFADNRLPLPPVELPPDDTPLGRQQRADLFNALPDDVFYDPDIRQFVQIDAQGRRIIQANLSGLVQWDDALLETSRYYAEARERQKRIDRERREAGGVYYFWDERLGWVELDPDDYEDGSFPLPRAELPDDSTPGGRQRRAILFLSLPENRYYDDTIGQWINIDEDGRHVIDADLSGYAPGRTLVGYEEDGSPIFATITGDEEGERERGPESIDRYLSETFIGEIYYAESLGHWVGRDQDGRVVIVDEEGYPIPFEELDTIDPRYGAQPEERFRGGRVNLEANAYQLQEGEFFPYIYDALQDVWIAFDSRTPLLLAEAPDYTWDPVTGYFTLLNEDTGEFEIYNEEGVEIDQEGNPIADQEREQDEVARLNLPTGEPHSQFDPNFDLPIAGSALRVAQAAASAMRATLEGDLLLSVELSTYQEGGERAGYIVGAFIPEAATDPDYALSLTEALTAAETQRADVPLGDRLHVASLEVPSTVPGVFVTAVEVWFTYVQELDTPEDIEEEEDELRDPRAPVIDPALLEESSRILITALMENTANYVFELLRDSVPVRTGRLRDSISIREEVPGGFETDRVLEVAARVYYAPFVGGYRSALDLALSQGQLYADQFESNIRLQLTSIAPLEPAPENIRSTTLPTTGPGIVISYAGALPDFTFGTTGEDFGFFHGGVVQWIRELFGLVEEQPDPLDANDVETGDLPSRLGIFRYPGGSTRRQAIERLGDAWREDLRRYYEEEEDD